MERPDLIPAAVRARLASLRLGAPRARGGDGFGLHHSRSRGAGLEFAQYRAYEPGDALRQIDWKLYARSDKFFVREAERDSPLTAWLLIDTSASMAQSDSLVDSPASRLDGARALAACVIELAVRQGDRFGLLAVGGSGLQLVPAGSGPRHRERCLLELQRLRASGGWPAEAQLRLVWERIRAGDLAIVLSDCFDDAVVAMALKLAAARREVCCVQLLTPDERDFPFRGGNRFVDPETGASMIADGAAARDDFLARFQAARRALAAQLAAGGIAYADYFLDQALDSPLRRLFAQRAQAGAPEPT